MTFKRNPSYWGRDLPINRGFWNFDEIRFDYYREANSHLEAFKRGLYDLRVEHDPTRWQTAYDFPAEREGRVLKESIPTGLPKASTFFVFNTRRPIFSDVRVREAIALLFDFEWINNNYFFDLYQRTASYFEGSELSSHRRPASPQNRRCSRRSPTQFATMCSTARGRRRSATAPGATAPRSSGRSISSPPPATTCAAPSWSNATSGRPFTFEIMVTARDDERLALLFSQSLKRIGITARVRAVDAVQFEGRRLDYDFDMIENRWDQSLSPGNEQAFYWGSAAADQPGTRNYIGVKSAAVDAMIAALLQAQERAEFVAAVRALDRVLISGLYTIPLFHLPEQWIVRWRTIARPTTISLYGYLFETSWRQDIASAPR